MSTLRASVCLENVIFDTTSGLMFEMSNAKLIVSYHVVQVIVITTRYSAHVTQL
jgi:hypothetical protein